MFVGDHPGDTRRAQQSQIAGGPYRASVQPILRLQLDHVVTRRRRILLQRQHGDQASSPLTCRLCILQLLLQPAPAAAHLRESEIAADHGDPGAVGHLRLDPAGRQQTGILTGQQAAMLPGGVRSRGGQDNGQQQSPVAAPARQYITQTTSRHAQQGHHRQHVAHEHALTAAGHSIIDQQTAQQRQILRPPAPDHPSHPDQCRPQQGPAQAVEQGKAQMVPPARSQIQARIAMSDGEVESLEGQVAPEATKVQHREWRSRHKHQAHHPGDPQPPRPGNRALLASGHQPCDHERRNPEQSHVIFGGSSQPKAGGASQQLSQNRTFQIAQGENKAGEHIERRRNIHGEKMRIAHVQKHQAKKKRAQQPHPRPTGASSDQESQPNRRSTQQRAADPTYQIKGRRVGEE